MIQHILDGVTQTIDKLLDIQPELEADSPEGKLLCALGNAVADYEDYLYPELSSKNV